jgi:transcriptional regulator GlxA family with amidase domain
LTRELVRQALTVLPEYHSPDALPEERQARADALVLAALVELDAASASPPDALVWGTRKHHQSQVVATMQRVWEDPVNVPTVADLAASAGYSVEHFSRIFRQLSGYTPQAYILRARTVRASEMLFNTSLSVTEIARRLGYSSPQFFARQFKSQTGMTARQSRENRSPPPRS